MNFVGQSNCSYRSLIKKPIMYFYESHFREHFEMTFTINAWFRSKFSTINFRGSKSYSLDFGEGYCSIHIYLARHILVLVPKNNVVSERKTRNIVKLERKTFKKKERC